MAQTPIPQVPQNTAKTQSKKVWLILAIVIGAILLWVLPVVTLRLLFSSGEKPSAYATEVMSDIETALQDYGSDHNHYPESIQELVARGYLADLPVPEGSDDVKKPYTIGYSPTREVHGGPTLSSDASRAGIDINTLGTCPTRGGGDTLYEDGPRQVQSYDATNPKEPTTAFCASKNSSGSIGTITLACGYELSYLRSTGSPFGEPDAPDVVLSKTVKSRYSQGTCAN